MRLVADKRPPGLVPIGRTSAACHRLPTRTDPGPSKHLSQKSPGLLGVHDSPVQMKRHQNSVGMSTTGSSVPIAAKDAPPSPDSVRALPVPPQESVADQAPDRLTRWTGKPFQPRSVLVRFVRGGDVDDLRGADGLPAVSMGGIGTGHYDRLLKPLNPK